MNAPAVFVGSTAAPASNGLASTYTVNKPAGVAAGDLLLIGLLTVDGTVSTSPSDLGLALLINTVTPAITSATRQVFYLYSKIATGTDPASWTFGLNASWWTSLVAADYRGASGIGTADWFAGTGPAGFDPGNNPIDAPTVTTTTGCTVVALFGAGVFLQNDVVTPPGSVTLRQPTTNGYSTYSWTDFTA